MEAQSLLVILIFCLALIYLGRMAYKALIAKKGCASGCAKCNVLEDITQHQ